RSLLFKTSRGIQNGGEAVYCARTDKRVEFLRGLSAVGTDVTRRKNMRPAVGALLANKTVALIRQPPVLGEFHDPIRLLADRFKNGSDSHINVALAGKWALMLAHITHRARRDVPLPTAGTHRTGEGVSLTVHSPISCDFHARSYPLCKTYRDYATLGLS